MNDTQSYGLKINKKTFISTAIILLCVMVFAFILTQMVPMGTFARTMYEGREVPVMHNWEAYLTSHYRDYMTPSPVLGRRTHTLFTIDFGKYENMSVEEIEKEVEEFGRSTRGTQST